MWGGVGDAVKQRKGAFAVVDTVTIFMTLFTAPFLVSIERKVPDFQKFPNSFVFI